MSFSSGGPDPDMLAHREKDFHHPYQPYEIQKDFMSAVYHCIEEGKVGILESPTGQLYDGKSLSLICGSLTWLREHKRKAFEARSGNPEDVLIFEEEDEPDWMIEHELREKRKVALQKKNEFESRLARIRAQERKTKARYTRGAPSHKRQKRDEGEYVTEEREYGNDAQYILDDYDSDDEVKGFKKHRASGLASTLSAETQALMEKLGVPSGRNGRDSDIAEEDEDVKVFYCSRTHSQITQFVSDLQRVNLPPAIPTDTEDDGNIKLNIEDEVHEQLKHLTLASRKNLCTNPKVAKLSNTTAINERCLEIQRPQASKEYRCSFLPTTETEVLVNDFRDHALASVRDIEDLVAIGKKLEICPYYASRPAIKHSEVITLPYPLLLQKSSRESLGYSLKGQVVLIDEAHNLMDVITSMQSMSVSLSQLQKARAQIIRYLQKFQKRLKGKNRVYVSQTVRLLDSLLNYLGRYLNRGESHEAAARGAAKEKTSAMIEGEVNIADLISGKGTDQINLLKLAKYLQESKLARKVNDYNAAADESVQSNRASISLTNQIHAQNPTIPVLMHVQSFLLTLMNPSAEGRFFYQLAQDGAKEVYLRYTLLDPTQHFRDIVEDARAVILAGGTMSPMNDYYEYLLSYLPLTKISSLSCGHVIPPSNLFATTISTAISGSEFDFKFEKRNLEKTILDLGAAVLTFLQDIPDGVVIFFPSYAYLDKCVGIWKRSSIHASKDTENLWQSMSMTKTIFQESGAARDQIKDSPASTSKATDVEKSLKAYSEEISLGKGAVMLAVMSGSLSEGINFSDRLGRGVIVIGLPFPNPHSAEWKAKMEYISQKSSKLKEKHRTGYAAKEFYENACMRVVNQCIGRAIRHKEDYAAILLIDKRYSHSRIKGKLPGWIKSELSNCYDAREASASLRSFFRGKLKGSKDS